MTYREQDCKCCWNCKHLERDQWEPVMKCNHDPPPDGADMCGERHPRAYVSPIGRCEYFEQLDNDAE